MHADEVGGGPLHRRHLDLLLQPPTIALAEGRFAGAQLVEIAAGDATMTGMEARVGKCHLPHRHVFGQFLVEAGQRLMRREGPGHLEVGDILQGVNAGVGAAAALEIDRGHAEHPLRRLD